ncbi:HD domain-containing protein [Pedobacter sp. ASV12]|uniref:HD domain-containing protein n=1 Tax=Pedobacter sp. ASV12 TaxID=2795120 RepID=UPI0018EDFC8B|nr:HD domain-containing protein [Pedobacter sp. ASV12]
MDFVQLEALVSDFVQQLFREKLSAKLYFHNVAHTQYVVNAAREIGMNAGLDAEELETVLLAAWFHDTGYTETYQQHELASVEIAVQFLAAYGLAKHRLDEVITCILATRFPQQPVCLVEKVICDADFYHFSMDNYLAFAQSLKQEWEEVIGLEYTPLQWNSINLKMLLNHQYFTSFGRHKLQICKEKNIRLLQQLI